MRREGGRERKRTRGDAHVDGEAGEPDDRVRGLVGEVQGDRVAALEALGEEPVREAVDRCVGGRQVGEEGEELGQRSLARSDSGSEGASRVQGREEGWDAPSWVSVQLRVVPSQT